MKTLLFSSHALLQASFGAGAGGRAGTFMELRVFNAKDIRAFSPYPEEELLVPMNSCFAVEYAVSSSDAAFLSGFGSLRASRYLFWIAARRQMR